MSDALCGPSNPLQQFKQQTSRDRTLQQDRLTSRPSPAQGFRSANPNAGHLDPEFEAFQAGVPPSELPHFQPFQPPPQQNYGGPVQQASPSWAADFQQMHISSPPPFQQQHMGPSTANWAQGFREHIAQTPPRAQTSASSPQQFQQMARYGGMNGFQSSFAPMSMGQGVQAKGKEPATEQFDEAAFERAFDQARDDMMGGALAESMSDAVAQDVADEIAATEQAPELKGHRPVQDYNEQLRMLEEQNKKRMMMAQQETTSGETMPTDEVVTDVPQMNPQSKQDYQFELMLLERQSKARLLQARAQEDLRDATTIEQQKERRQALAEVEREFQATTDELEQHRTRTRGDAHQIQQEPAEEQEQAEERTRDDDDALAATAHELLEKVEHNQTHKFRNSQFLGLMRKLRDREVKVEGDKMVETNNASTSSTAAETQTLNSPSATHVPRFGNSEQRPNPLRATVDTRPYEYGIPHEEQDLDLGRRGDGQEVVDLLNQPGSVTEDIGSYDPELAERYGDSTNGTSSPFVMTRFPPGMRTVV